MTATFELAERTETVVCEYAVSDAEPMPLSENRPALHAPSRVRVVVRNGEVLVTVWGLRVLRTGKLGAERVMYGLGSGSAYGRALWPEWLQRLVDEATA